MNAFVVWVTDAVIEARNEIIDWAVGLAAIAVVVGLCIWLG